MPHLKTLWWLCPQQSCEASRWQTGGAHPSEAGWQPLPEGQAYWWRDAGQPSPCPSAPPCVIPRMEIVTVSPSWDHEQLESHGPVPGWQTAHGDQEPVYQIPASISWGPLLAQCPPPMRRAGEMAAPAVVVTSADSKPAAQCDSVQALHFGRTIFLPQPQSPPTTNEISERESHLHLPPGWGGEGSQAGLARLFRGPRVPLPFQSPCMLTHHPVLPGGVWGQCSAAVRQGSSAGLVPEEDDLLCQCQHHRLLPQLE